MTPPAWTAFVGGLSAVAGGEMLLVSFAILCGAAVADSRKISLRSLAILGLIFSIILAAVWSRADLVPPGRFSRWLALVPLLGLMEMRRFRAGWEPWMAPMIAVCTAALVLFWRVDRFGPVLAALRGDWQAPLPLMPRALYHLGTGLGLGLVFCGLTLLIARVPERFRGAGSWALLVIAVLVVVLDLVAPVQQWLLLHAPPTRVG